MYFANGWKFNSNLWTQALKTKLIYKFKQLKRLHRIKNINKKNTYSPQAVPRELAGGRKARS